MTKFPPLHFFFIDGFGKRPYVCMLMHVCVPLRVHKWTQICTELHTAAYKHTCLCMCIPSMGGQIDVLRVYFHPPYLRTQVNKYVCVQVDDTVQCRH